MNRTWSIQQSRRSRSGFCGITGEQYDRSNLRQWVCCTGSSYGDWSVVPDDTASRHAPVALLAILESLNSDPELLPTDAEISIVDSEQPNVARHYGAKFEDGAKRGRWELGYIGGNGVPQLLPHAAAAELAPALSRWFHDHYGTSWAPPAPPPPPAPVPDPALLKEARYYTTMAEAKTALAKVLSERPDIATATEAASEFVNKLCEIFART